MSAVAAATGRLRALAEIALGDRDADRVVPPAGHTVWLTVVASGAMAFLAVFALALSLASARLADRWAEGLARASTVRISAPAGQGDAQARAVLAILASTPGVERAREIGADERAALLAPWLGPDLPLDSLPLPRLVEVEEGEDFDAQGLRLRLQAEVPGAVLDDHTRWRAPLVHAAERLRSLGWLALGLIAVVTGVTITLGAQAALAANTEVIRVLRLVGARDSFVVRAFTRRFTLRALAGAAGGALLGALAIAALPAAEGAGGFLTGLGFSGAGWLLPAAIPPLAALVAFLATRSATARALRRFE
ncbi:ABC transporter permease [Jannaschia sp. W003]|uniref:cell division protein FtsX n=1 Tax=Jannaschia sp. W003 TaxID=2867012 RepID=UPI0021A84FE3|nr:cell division protein FtsX [Jannaschia sp. W003]UWQ22589.1 cell division protein FtsX [Jannaschia sp. W003]